MRTKQSGTEILVELDPDEIETAIQHYIAKYSGYVSSGRFEVHKDRSRSGQLPRFKLVPKPQAHWADKLLKKLL